MNVDKLKPFTLYQFKVKAIRHDVNRTSLYSESIECYTNEDGKNLNSYYLDEKRKRRKNNISFLYHVTNDYFSSWQS